MGSRPARPQDRAILWGALVGFAVSLGLVLAVCLSSAFLLSRRL